MVKIYKQPFAHDGDTIAIPDASQPDGKMSNTDGWTPDYQLPKTDPNYKPVGRQEMNGVFKEVTEAVGEIQQFGFAKWQPITWPQGARVVEGDVVYRALTQTSQQPPHADWADDTDGLVNLTGNQTIAGVKTFSSFPVTPSAAPTDDYQAANKKYVDDSAIGVGQTWQDVTSGIINNTIRTNTTGRPIQVIISGGRATTSLSEVYIDGILAAVWGSSGGEPEELSITFTLPSGGSYRIVNIPQSVFYVLELK